MKKYLITGLGIMLITTQAWANPPLKCTYSKTQEVVRSARWIKDLQEFEGRADLINAPQACGGNLLQLSVIRGNPTLSMTLMKYGGDAKQMVSVADYDIPGAPQEIPMILFAARYTVNINAFQEFLEGGADAKVKDSMGNDILWYFEQNPMMRNSDVTEGGLKEMISHKERFGENWPPKVD